MALPDYLKQSLGTAIVWGTPSASGVTKNLTLDNLLSATARQGVYADLGSLWDQDYILAATIEAGTQPAITGTVDIYLAYSHDATYWPAGLDGTDRAFPTNGDTDEDEWTKQLGFPDLVFIPTADANTAQKQNPTIIRPRGRYVTVVVDNNMDQGLRNTTPDSDNASRIYLIPLKSSVED